MFKNKLINVFILLYLIKLDFVFASTNSKVELSTILLMSIIVIFNFICSNDDVKNKMILSKIFKLNFSDIEINYIIANIIRLLFILAYYFFVIPIIIDFFIASIQLIIRIIKNKKQL